MDMVPYIRVAYIRHKEPRPKRRGDGQGQDLHTYATATTLAANESTDPSPMTPTTAPVSAAAEQQNEHDDNENQFHGKTPLMVLALFAPHGIVQSAESILHLPFNLVGLAFVPSLGIWAFYQTAADPRIVRATAPPR
jgi:hypothetical protein